MVVVEVRQRTLGEAGRGWGPAAITGRGWSYLRSGSDHWAPFRHYWAHMVVVEVRQRVRAWMVLVEIRQRGKKGRNKIKSNNAPWQVRKKLHINFALFGKIPTMAFNLFHLIIFYLAIFWYSVWNISWHSIYYVFWHSTWHIFCDSVFFLPFNILFGIFFDVLFGIFKRFYLVNFLMFYLVYYLVYLATFYGKDFPTSYLWHFWQFFWRMLRHFVYYIF